MSWMLLTGCFDVLLSWNPKVAGFAPVRHPIWREICLLQQHRVRFAGLRAFTIVLSSNYQNPIPSGNNLLNTVNESKNLSNVFGRNTVAILKHAKGQSIPRWYLLSTGLFESTMQHHRCRSLIRTHDLHKYIVNNINLRSQTKRTTRPT